MLIIQHDNDDDDNDDKFFHDKNFKCILINK